ncbi:hypothetical protein AYO22_06392 [Fonsecaea multimorphosa]|nr:hypothetical protein AYO22_06392 [Fonsecaea multimorphosa]
MSSPNDEEQRQDHTSTRILPDEDGERDSPISNGKPHRDCGRLRHSRVIPNRTTSHPLQQSGSNKAPVTPSTGSSKPSVGQSVSYGPVRVKLELYSISTMRRTRLCAELDYAQNSTMRRTRLCAELDYAQNSTMRRTRLFDYAQNSTMRRTRLCAELDYAQNSTMRRTRLCAELDYAQNSTISKIGSRPSLA